MQVSSVLRSSGKTIKEEHDMGFFDKVKDFLDDGKINGSNAKPQQQTAENTQPAVENTQTTAPEQTAAKKDPLASLSPEERANIERAQAIAAQQKAMREAAGIKEPEPMSEEERRVPKDTIVELPFKIDASMMPYQDANGNSVAVKMMGNVKAKALYDISDKEQLAIVLKNAPQMAYYNVLMKQQVPANELANCVIELQQSMAETLKMASDFEIQSINIVSIRG